MDCNGSLAVSTAFRGQTAKTLLVPGTVPLTKHPSDREKRY